MGKLEQARAVLVDCRNHIEPAGHLAFDRIVEAAGIVALEEQREAAIPDVVGTEPRLTIGEAREALNTQLRCMADEIRVWGTVVDARVDDAIDVLITAAVLTDRACHADAERSSPSGLAAYRPQHHDGCASRKCGHSLPGMVRTCGFSRGFTEIHYVGAPDSHAFVEQPCSCGLAALLSGEKET